MEEENELGPVLIAFMGNPGDLIPEVAIDDEELFWAEFERGWEMAEIEQDERAWAD